MSLLKFITHVISQEIAILYPTNPAGFCYSSFRSYFSLAIERKILQQQRQQQQQYNERRIVCHQFILHSMIYRSEEHVRNIRQEVCLPQTRTRITYPEASPSIVLKSLTRSLKCFSDSCTSKNLLNHLIFDHEYLQETIKFSFYSSFVTGSNMRRVVVVIGHNRAILISCLHHSIVLMMV